MRGWTSRIIPGLAIFAALNLLAVVVAYALYPGYLEHGEASISATAFRLLQGHPAYYAFGAPERISNVYGPWTYLWHSWPLALFGASLTTSKIAAVLGPVLVVIGAWMVGRRHGRRGEAVAVVLAAGFVIFQLGFPVTIRPDSLLTVLVTISVLAMLRAEGRTDMAWAETLVMGVAGGIAVNVKIHAGLYLAPAVVLHLLPNWRRLLPMAMVGLAALALPFASPLFPLSDYLSWFGPMSGKENTWNAFRILWMKFAFYLGFPLISWALAGFGGLKSRERIYLAVYVACAVLVLFPATKTGASHHYYLPLLPVLVDLTLRALSAAGPRPLVERVFAVLTVLLLFMAGQTEKRFFKVLEWTESREVVAEIEEVLRSHPGTAIQMGVGGPRTEEKFYLYSWRNLPVFVGGPYTMDSGIVMEMTKLGVAMPAEAIRRMAACETQLWLTPHGEQPFSLIGYYEQTVYDPVFRQTFAAHHHLESSGKYFDLWRCQE
jgi:hypothetical protein